MPFLSALEQLIARRYFVDSGADEIHRVRCQDQTRISVKRFHAAKGSDAAKGSHAGQGRPARQHPVLCIPGLGADSHNFDAPAPHGFARFLTEQGFDTWVVDLRGTGLSDLSPQAWPAVSFDDFVHLDLTAVMSHILKVTNAPGLHLVGHSMGGMVIYAMLGSTALASSVRSAVTLCSPVGFAEGLPPLSRIGGVALAPLLRLGTSTKLGRRLTRLQARRLVQLIAPLLLRRGSHALTAHLAPPGNIDERYLRRLAHRTVQDVPQALLAQFHEWVRDDRFCNRDRSLDYRAQLAGVTTPTLVVVAPADRVARPASVLRAGDLLVNAEILHCGLEQGFSADYGHIDVIFGRHAHQEVFPRLSGFFERHDGRSVEPPPRGADASPVNTHPQTPPSWSPQQVH